VGHVLTYLRSLAGIDRERVAEALRISPREYFEIEAGERDLGLADALILADLFGTTPEGFVQLTDVWLHDWMHGHARGPKELAARRDELFQEIFDRHGEDAAKDRGAPSAAPGVDHEQGDVEPTARSSARPRRRRREADETE
jgi:transcriptional regulator with XRE-family HTH domain